MDIMELEHVVRNLDHRVSRIEEILPTLATKEDLKAFATKEDLKAFATKQDVREGDEETRRQMRVLHEDLISRISLLGEQLNGRRS